MTRLLMISNQVRPEGFAGFRDTYERMVQTNELDAFRYLTPAATAEANGQAIALSELFRDGQSLQPDVILVATPGALGHDPDWVRRFLRACGDPFVVYWESDLWHRWAKPINRSMRTWFKAADVVFTTAREPHISMFRRAGARDVRFVPNTYCHVFFADEERTEPSRGNGLAYDVVVIGSRLSHWGGLSRVPGAMSRAKLVRKLQHSHDIRLAVYGAGWSGRGAQGALPYPEQARAIRRALVSVNWDHFSRYESYSSDRLPISLLAGRPHVTTAHPGMDWLPGEQIGVFREPSVSAVHMRVRELMAAPAGDVIRLGIGAHRWAKARLSNRQAARFMLAASDQKLLAGLSADPWLHFASEWPA